MFRTEETTTSTESAPSRYENLTKIMDALDAVPCNSLGRRLMSPHEEVLAGDLATALLHHAISLVSKMNEEEFE